jgi:hypothetical protein
MPTRLPTHEEIDEEQGEVKATKLTWVRDAKGSQGEVLFDGKSYWLVRIDKNTGRCFNMPLTQKEWEQRNTELAERKK